MMNRQQKVDFIRQHVQWNSVSLIADFFGVSNGSIFQIIYEHDIKQRAVSKPFKLGDLTVKHCSKCERLREIEEFTVKANGQPFSRCKPCDHERYVNNKNSG